MAALPNTPFTSIEDFRVAVDAPVSTDLMTDIAVDLNNLRSILRDGASAIESLIIDTITIEGAGTAFQLDNDGNVDGNFNVTGIFSTGIFFSTEQFLMITAL